MRSIAVNIAVCLLLSRVVGGQEVQERPSDSNPKKPPRFILLDNEKVIQGDVEKTASGYAVVRNGGSVLFRAEQVTHVGDTLLDVYKFKSDRVPRHDVGERFKLYQWCLVNRLEKEAEAELRIVLEVDPGNQVADRQLRFLQRRREPRTEEKQAATTPARIAPAPPSEVIGTFIRGHGQPTFSKYIELEKVLVNRCATAACHGSARHAGDFRLYRRGEGQHVDQRQTARNLQNVLKRIDLKNPQKSEILSRAIEAHGNSAVPAMGGVNDPQFKELRDWVYQVQRSYSEELSGEPAVVSRGHVEPRDAGDDFAADRRRSETRTSFHRPEATFDHGVDVRGVGAIHAADDAPEPAPKVMGKAPLATIKKAATKTTSLKTVKKKPSDIEIETGSPPADDHDPTAPKRERPSTPALEPPSDEVAPGPVNPPPPIVESNGGTASPVSRLSGFFKGGLRRAKKTAPIP